MITLDISSALDGINPERVAKAIKEGLAIGIIKLQGTARKEAPIDTGFLRNHIQYTARDNGWTQELNSGAEYSYFVHEGRRGRGGNPFFTRAIEAEEDNIISALQSKIKEALG